MPTLRPALPADIPALNTLVELSVRALLPARYTPTQIALSVNAVFGIDSQLIADGTYYAVESGEGALIACGGWGKRSTLCGGDRCSGREDSVFLNPATDAARIRAFFVHPAYARQGLGSLLLETCEQAALAAGFHRFEMGATLTGVPLYSARGYRATEDLGIALADGSLLPIVRMEKHMLR